MTEKHYADDWAKAKSRQLVKRVIERTVLQKKRAEDIKVLFFPGIDAREVYEVYLSLGFLPENLYGLERERDIADHIEAHHGEVNIIRNTKGRPLSLEEYVIQEEKTHFDVVSLDYIGPLIISQIDAMKILREKQQVKEFVFHSANLLRRDGYSVSQYVCGDAATKFWDAQHALRSQDPGRVTPAVSAFLKEQTRRSLTEYREEGFDQEQKAQGYSAALRLGPTGSRIGGLCTLIEYAYGSAWYEKHKEIIEPILLEGKIRPGGTAEDRKIARECVDGLGATLQKRAELICKSAQLPLSYASSFLQGVIIASKGNFYFAHPEQYERYSYVSESGAPMIGDIYLMQRPKELLAAGRKLAKMLGFPSSVPSRDTSNIQQAYNALVRSFGNYLHHARFELSEPRGRLFLGNAAKPLLTQKRFTEELARGNDVAQVKRTYRGWKNKPLEVWEAAYRGQSPPVPVTASEANDEDAEISKEDIIQLLREGNNVDDIHAAWPDYSKDSLRAYKAHLTRGRYDGVSGEVKT